MHHKEKWTVMMLAVLAFLTAAPLRARGNSAGFGPFSPKDIAPGRVHSYATSAAMSYSLAVDLQAAPLRFGNDDKNKKKKKHDPDPAAEPGVVPQLVLGLLWLVGFKLILRPPKSVRP